MLRTRRLATQMATALSLTTLTAAASAVEFHGYARAGIGQNVDGGQQVCYGTGGVAAHYVGRLGDECDMYAELSFSDEVFAQDGKSFKIFSTIAYGTYESGGSVQFNSQGNSFQAQKDDDSDNPFGGGRLAVREIYATASGILGDSTLWIGKRFGQRKDIHIMDLFYIMNSGYGAGFDGLTVGPGKFSFQWTQSASDEGFDSGLDGVDGTNGSWERLNKLDFRYNLPVATGSVDMIAIIGQPTLTDDQEDANAFNKTGYLLTLEHSMPFMGGFNKFAVQYGTNSLTDGVIGNFGGINHAFWFAKDFANGTNESASAWRILNHGVAKFGQKIELGYAITYAESDIDIDDANDPWRDYTRYNVVLRPTYKWDNFNKTLLELGYDVNEPNDDLGDVDETLTKVTLAQAVGAGPGFFARPELRLFVSYYDGERANRDANLMFGAQMEAWW